MKISKFIGIFSHWDRVPIDPMEDVKKAIVEHYGPALDIKFYLDMSLNPEILLGFIEVYRYREDGHKRRLAKVTVAGSLPLEHQRFIACKEQLHILDRPGVRAAKLGDIGNLIDKIRLPAERDGKESDGAQAVSDHLAEFYAVAVMFPLAARNRLKREIDEGRMTVDDVVREVGIPKTYVELVLGDYWPELHAVLVGL